MRAVNLIFVLLLVSSVMGKPALDTVDKPKVSFTKNLYLLF